MNLTIGAKVVFKKNVDEHGVTAGSIGHIDDGLNCHVLASSEFPCGDNPVYVSVCGKVLILPVEFFSDEFDASSNSGAGVVVGINGEQFNKTGSSDGENSSTGIVDAGANVGAGDYSIEKAIDDLEFSIGDLDEFCGARFLDDVSKYRLKKLIEKMETIAA